MNNKKDKFLMIVLTLLLVSFTVSSVSATGGYFRHGYGIKYGALAGAGSALSLSSIGAATNPASLSFLGTRYDINVAYFSPDRKYTVTGNPSGFPGTFGLAPGTIESDSKAFPIPTMGASWELNETMVIGAMFFANGGMNTDYQTMTFGDPSSPGTGVNLEQMFFGITYSYQFIKGHAVGVTPLFAFQRFAAKGLAAFSNFSADAASLTGNRMSTSTGFGVKVGYQGEITPQIRVGASYQMKTKMGEFDEYKGLFAEQGGFDIPASWNAGVAVTPFNDFTFAADVQQILYGGVKSISNAIDPMALPPAFPDGSGGFVPNPNQVPLGSDNGSGFGWKDVTVVKLGLMYEGVKEWTFMAGFSVGTNPVDESEVLFNILAPGIIKNHITAGVTKQFANNHEVTIAFMYAPANTVTGANSFEAPNQQTIAIEMNQFQVEVGYAFH